MKYNLKHSEIHYHECDICIIGAGVAGITLANALVQQNIAVSLFESGDEDYDSDTQELYAGEITNELPPVPLDGSRLRFLGGTSNHWAGQCGPFDAVDFQKRRWFNPDGWAGLSREELEPFYRQAHTEHELLNYVDFAKEQTNTKTLYKFNDYFQHVILQQNPVRYAGKLSKSFDMSRKCNLYLNANLTKVKFNQSHDVCKHLEFNSLTGNTLVCAAQKYVFACGGIENARLLLHTPIKNENIGRYYSFHPRLETMKVRLYEPIPKNLNPYDWNVTSTKQTIQLKNFIKLNDSEQKKLGVGNHAIYFQHSTLEDQDSYSALKRLIGKSDEEINFFSDFATVMMNLNGIWDNYKHNHLNDYYNELSVVSYLDQKPNYESRVRLNSEKDQLGMRRISVNWTMDSDDINGLLKFNELLAIQLETSGIGKAWIDPAFGDHTSLLELIKSDSGGGHQIGTTRMSSTAASGVVDINCKVHGVENLYCAGSSVFSTTSWVNPTLTISALALRLASHLQKSVQHGK